jgi:hypothetical protein
MYPENDFCGGNWIHPNSQGQDLAKDSIRVLVGCSESNPDYKWVLTEADSGKYQITVSLRDSTINFEKEEPTSIANSEQNPVAFKLEQNYPNPFNPVTQIAFQINSKSNVTLKIFDITGREIQTLVSSSLPEGYHTVQFDGRGLSSGVYFYTLTSDAFSVMKKMTLLK